LTLQCASNGVSAFRADGTRSVVDPIGSLERFTNAATDIVRAEVAFEVCLLHERSGLRPRPAQKQASA
jgi:hypothetical protein